VKVADFGLAKPAEAGDGLTGSGRLMGTLDYMAPEQWRDAAAVDIRADIYSLGCTLYALLAGAPPFKDVGGMLDKEKAHRSQPPKPLTGVPAELWAAVARMLAKRPDDRYQSPGEVAAVFKEIVRSSGGKPASPETKREAGVRDSAQKSRPTEPVATPPSPAAGRPRRRRSRVTGSPLWLTTAVVAGAVGLCALVAGVAWAVVGRFDGPTTAGPTATADAADDHRRLFDGRTLAGWRKPAANAGTWEVRDGLLTGIGGYRPRQAENDRQYECALLETDRSDFKDVRLTVTYRRSHPTDAYCYLAVRSERAASVPDLRSPHFNGVLVYLGGATQYASPHPPGGVTVRTGFGGNDRSAKQDNTIAAQTDAWTTVVAELVGDRIRTTVEGKPGVVLTDGSFTAGRIGLWCTAGGKIEVKSVDVEELSSGAPPAPSPAVPATVIDPNLAYHFRYASVGQSLQPHAGMRLMTDGGIQEPGGQYVSGSWRLSDNGRVLVLRWPKPGAPGGVWVDTYTSTDGVNFTGTNNDRRPAKLYGILASP
jgi:hypothetical protein